jgi:hypothetical protein|tara:strand:+ start:2551 stop:2808 length:258 start_codon:yes stop_codon:yes gene_type:complete
MPKYTVTITVEYEEIVEAETEEAAIRIATDNLPDNDNLSMSVDVSPTTVENDVWQEYPAYRIIGIGGADTPHSLQYEWIPDCDRG